MGKKILYHSLFWSFSLSLCAFILAYKESWTQGFLLTAIYAPVPILSAYVIDLFLVEKYLLKGRLLKFSVYLIYVLIFSLLVLLVLNTFVFIYFAEYRYDLLPSASKDIIVLFANLYLLVFLFVSFKSVRRYSVSQQQQEAAQRRAVEAELKLLRAQLNPHFLFNTLNNLYSLALKKSDKAPEAILKLSALLDSVLKTHEQKKIALQEELKAVEDLIYLESLRYQDKLIVDVTSTIKETAELNIPPLSIVVLIENCFKHAGRNESGLKQIKLVLREDTHWVYIQTNNLVNHKQETKNKGIGLNNLQKQLDHIYGSNYSLERSVFEENYLVELKLPK